MDNEKESNSESKIPLHKRVTDPTKSSLKKYQELAVGEKGLLALLKYEIFILVFGGLPGAIGYLSRRYFYKYLLNEMGKYVILGRNINITNPKKINIGNNVLIGDNCELDAKYGQAIINIGDNVIIGRNSMIRSRGGSLIIGENSVIGANCDLVARGSTLEIERNHLMGPYCYLSTGRRVFDNKDVPMNTQPIKSKPILIEEDVWLGSRVTVLAGGIVRKGAVIGASSLVNHEIEEYSVACGTPARKMKYR